MVRVRLRVRVRVRVRVHVRVCTRVHVRVCMRVHVRVSACPCVWNTHCSLVDRSLQKLPVSLSPRD